MMYRIEMRVRRLLAGMEKVSEWQLLSVVPVLTEKTMRQVGGTHRHRDGYWYSELTPGAYRRKGRREEFRAVAIQGTMPTLTF